MIQEAAGRLLYHTLPVKRAAVLYSAMRSGSTLLKALLGTNFEVSHLPEVQLQEWPREKYAFYFRLWCAARQPVVVLKKPCFYSEVPYYPFIPPISFMPIVLIRNPVDTVLSLVKRSSANKRVKLGLDTYGKSPLDYWCEVYRNIFEHFKARPASPHIVFYEELVAEPQRVTEKLFRFLGMKNTTGVKNYEPYGKWLWGQDDAGELIRTLTVNGRPRQIDAESHSWEEETRKSEEAAAVMRLYWNNESNYYDYLKSRSYF